MDVDREVAAANRRVERGIDRNYLIAMARIEGMTPEAYAAKLDAERPPVPTPMEQIGAIYRQLNDSIAKMAEDFARGWQSGGLR